MFVRMDVEKEKKMMMARIGKSVDSYHYHYSGKSIRGLKTYYNSLKQSLYINNKWSYEELKFYCKKNKEKEFEFWLSLIEFEKQYSSRVKSLPSFKYFLHSMRWTDNKENYEITHGRNHIRLINTESSLEKGRQKISRKSKITLKDENNMAEFLLIVKQLKNQLNCNNEDIINIIHKNIYTGYSKQTLLKYYYSSNSEKKEL